MQGYVAITDFEWFEFLATRREWDEVNFWQPRPGGLLNAAPGTPFLFKLKARHGSYVAGYAFFTWRSRLPAWMAWESFGEANGAPDFASFIRVLAGLRQEADAAGQFEIGCLLLSTPVFFTRDQWIPAPADWSGSIQRGKYYDLAADEGRRMWEACLARGEYPEAAGVASGAVLHESASARYGAAREMRPRLGQGGFRIAVADVYQRTCAVSTEHSLPALEAAHIVPYGEGGAHDVRNGLLLRADIHRLYDKGYVTVTPDHQFLVSPRLKHDYANGRVYYELQERIARAGGIHLPQAPEHHPDPKLLERHWKEKYVA